MNEIFKNNGKKIVLDDKYHLEPDAYKGLILVLNEERQRKKVDKKIRKETGEVETYNFQDKWYYPKVSMTLEKYLQLTLNSSSELTEIIERLKGIENKIESFK